MADTKDERRPDYVFFIRGKCTATYSYCCIRCDVENEKIRECPHYPTGCAIETCIAVFLEDETCH